MSFNDALVKEFDAKACGEICDPLKFIQRWQRALPPEAVVTSSAVGDYQKYVCRMVSYYHGHDLRGNVWAIPDLMTTTKLKKFAYQEEYRFADTKTDAFKFEKVRVELVDRKARPIPKIEHFPLAVGQPLNMALESQCANNFPSTCECAELPLL